MKGFQTIELEAREICFRLEFTLGVYMVVFRELFETGEMRYRYMQYRNQGEEEFSILDDEVWEQEISQVLRIIEVLRPLEVKHRLGGADV